MKKSFVWTEKTKDPVDNKVRNELREHLISIRSQIQNNNYNEYLRDVIKNKTVLDIGICEHTRERIHNKNWKHKYIMENSKSCVGIDIDSDLIDYVKNTYPKNKFIECDATSDKNLKSKFDVIHVGDVIEHIDNLSGLFKFCKRHLSKEGKVIMRTPNGYCFNYVYLANKYGTDNSNMEHVSYVFPTHALELARRHKMYLSSYLVQYKKGFTIKGILKSCWLITKLKFRHAIAELFFKPEKYSTIYVYEFENAS